MRAIPKVGFNIQLSRSQWLQGLGLLGHMNSRQLRLDEFGASALLAHKAGPCVVRAYQWQIILWSPSTRVHCYVHAT